MSTHRAIVAFEPQEQGKPDWRMEDVEVVGEPQDDEILVKMVATGVCHTDIVLSSVPEGAMGIGYPKVLGHEGAAHVVKKGSKVTTVEEGDPVLLSFTCCRECTPCKDQHPGFCDSFGQRNYIGEPERMRLKDGGKGVHASFFGQSSFSSYGCVKESSAVNVKKLIKSEEELKLFAPLGCGIQTGAGTVLSLARANAASRIVVLGLGGVGLSCIMGGKIAGAKKIIGIDRVQSRLDLAKELGATDVINTSDGMELVEKVKQLTNGDGGSIVVDTTGVPALINEGYKFTGKTGKFFPVGVPPFEFQIEFNAVEFINSGKQVISSIEGDVVPQEFIPKMIQWYRDGKFPFDKFCEIDKAENFKENMERMHKGSLIKPILVW